MDEMLSNELTSNQKNIVYTEMLIPMKNKISQILLYDTTAAAKFLDEYNKIASNEGFSVGELMNAINSLEFAIQEYEQTTGKEKISEEKGKILSKDIRDLSASAIELTTLEFENRFIKLREGYDGEIINQNYQDRDLLEKEFYSLQADLLMRVVSENREQIDLRGIIKEKDKQFLSIWVMQKVNELKNNPNLSEFANKINEILLLKDDAVLIPELWSWLNAAEKGKRAEKNENQKSNKEQEKKALVVRKEQKQLTFWDKLAKRFSKNPTFPLDIRDIKKINIEWLISQLPKEMQIEAERERLEKEDKVTDDIYEPSSRFVVFKKMQEILQKCGQNKRTDILYGDNNVNIEMKTNQDTSSFALKTEFETRSVDTRMSIEIAGQVERAESTKSLASVLEYAEWLDEICGSNFKQNVLKEMKEYYFDKKITGTKLIYNLIECLGNMTKEYEERKLDVFSTEEEKRERFYKEHPLMENSKKNNEPIIPKRRLKPDPAQHIEPDESFERI